MKLAVVVQRYGAQINGGAELHARYIVDLLAKHHRVEVLTTCARDYVTWRDEYAEGTETIRGVPVRRFRVSRERDPLEFGRRSAHVFEQPHSLADELAWIESEGPTSPALVEHLRTHAADYDYIIFFSYRYYHAYHGVRAVADKAILVPTAERDAAIGLSLFGPIFRGVRALMYNSHEERAMIQAAAQNVHVPGVVVGVGSDVPRNPVAARFRRKFKIDDPFIVYVGRIDENKGCRELFSYFTRYGPRLGQRLQLVLIGQSILPIPNHPHVRHLGFVSDQDKFDAMAAADALVMPSYYESLSMVALEAWALGKPVLANGRCDVLRGQCIRSRAGLYYESYEEFAETLFALTTNRTLAQALGDNGRAYFDQHYAWSVIERKYQDMLKQLAQEDAQRGDARRGGAEAGRGGAATTAGTGRIDPLPGWLTRRRKTLPSAMAVSNALPHGPAVDGDDRSGATSSAWSGSVDRERLHADAHASRDDASAEGAAASAAASMRGRDEHSYVGPGGPAERRERRGADSSAQGRSARPSDRSSGASGTPREGGREGRSGGRDRDRDRRDRDTRGPRRDASRQEQPGGSGAAEGGGGGRTGSSAERRDGERGQQGSRSGERRRDGRDRGGRDRGSRENAGREDVARESAGNDDTNRDSGGQDGPPRESGRTGAGREGREGRDGGSHRARRGRERRSGPRGGRS